MLIIGDVHGKIDQYKQIIEKEKAKESVQLGDFGFKSAHDWFLENMDCAAHKVLFGNHDYYPYLFKEHSRCNICAFDNRLSIFYVRGAYSMDWKFRAMGLDLFSEEEISYNQFEPVLRMYERWRPAIVVSHDCPQFLLQPFFAYSNCFITKTGQLLDALYNVHQPSTWIFGHHHRSKKMQIGKTLFRCLNELEYTYI